mmetsp:Transcript_151010/g.263888  ORF Transcript_151010/g.263888 Transcript_151010/m.263888 type:complete len:113 (+) Transcript_151010:2851-3189(+)
MGGKGERGHAYELPRSEQYQTTRQQTPEKGITAVRTSDASTNYGEGNLQLPPETPWDRKNIKREGPFMDPKLLNFKGTRSCQKPNLCTAQVGPEGADVRSRCMVVSVCATRK